MSTKTLESIIFSKKSKIVYDYNYPSELINFFVKSLEIDKVINNLFNFNTGRAKEQAFRIIQELSNDYDKTRERQECLKYLIETDKFGDLFNMSNYIIRTFYMLLNMKVWRELKQEYHTTVYYDSYSLNELFDQYKALLSSLKTFGTETKGSPINILEKEIDSTLNSQWFKELQNKFPREEFDAFNLLKNNFDKFHEVNAENEKLYDVIRNDICSKEHTITTLDYFMGFADGFRRLKKQGVEITFPEITKGSYRVFEVKDAINPLLYLGANRDKIKVSIDSYCDELQPIRIITGENKYGKTMALKTVGQIYAFAQAGLPFLAKSVKLKPVDKILANIGLAEDTMKGKSTYQNINDTTFHMLEAATPRSVLLLDEPTSGTYDLKACAQAKLYLKWLAIAGFQAWVVTHHLKLTEIEKEYSQILNLTSEVIKGKHTYRLIEGVFVPTEETIELDYRDESVRTAVFKGVNYGEKAKEKRYFSYPAHSERLKKLEENGQISQNRLGILKKIYGQRV